jgi:hypothetical protein
VVVADIALPDPRFPLVPGAIPAVDVTADGLADFLVSVQAADTTPALVVSGDGGAWRLVAQSGTAGDVYFARDPQVEDGRLTTTVNGCVPNCASGRTTTVTWVYDRSSGVFVGR